MASIDDIVTDVENQPSTREAVGRLLSRLGDAYVQAINEDDDGGRGFAEALRERGSELCDAVIRIAERPSGVDQPSAGDQPSGHLPGGGQSASGYAQADEAFTRVEGPDDTTQPDQAAGNPTAPGTTET